MKFKLSAVTSLAFVFLFILMSAALLVLGQVESAVMTIGKDAYTTRPFSFILIDPSVLYFLSGASLFGAIIAGITAIRVARP